MAKINQQKRARILAMFNGKCAYCGVKLTEFNQTIDHIIPRIKGGTNMYENLFPSCGWCNALKSDRNVDEFRTYVTGRANEYARCMGGKTVQSTKFFFERWNKK